MSRPYYRFRLLREGLILHTTKLFLRGNWRKSELHFPRDAEYRAIFNKIHNFKSALYYMSYPERLAFWPKAAAGFQGIACKQLELYEASVLQSIPESESEAQKMDVNDICLQLMVKEQVQKRELMRKGLLMEKLCGTEGETVYGEENEDEIDTETEGESKSESETERGTGNEDESENESEISSSSDSSSDSESEGEDKTGTRTALETGSDSPISRESRDNDIDSDSDSDWDWDWDWVHHYDFELYPGD